MQRQLIRKKRVLEVGNGKSKRLSINNLFPKISNSKKRRFLIGYAAKGRIKQAARASGVDWTYHYRWMREDEDYKAAFEIAGEVSLVDDDLTVHPLAPESRKANPCPHTGTGRELRLMVSLEIQKGSQ